MKHKIKHAIQTFGITWKRWIIPVNGGVLAICSIIRILSPHSFELLYSITLTIAITIIVVFELWYYKANKKGG